MKNARLIEATSSELVVIVHARQQRRGSSEHASDSDVSAGFLSKSGRLAFIIGLEDPVSCRPVHQVVFSWYPRERYNILQQALLAIQRKCERSS